MPVALAAALSLLIAGTDAPQRQEPVVVPVGVTIPIRFLRNLRSGRDTAGSPLLVQTMGALSREGCVVVPPFTQVRATIVVSRGGGWLGRRGELDLRFDSLEVQRGRWVPLRAVLDSLEYAQVARLGSTGRVDAPGSRTRRAVRAGAAIGIAGLVEVAVIPTALLGTYGLVRRGPRVQILAGEVGRLRLTAPLVLGGAGACRPLAAHPELDSLPALPRFAPRTATRSEKPGDPINLVFLGSGVLLDSAFRRAGWIAPHAASLRAVAREVVAALADRPAYAAPLSTQYFAGRQQDLAYELAGPNARIRDHLRIWLLDSLALVWVGAATKDVGIYARPWRGRVTHGIDPEIDRERDFIVETLEAGGCADLVAYLRLPGASTRMRNATGQTVVTDGRVAVVRVGGC